MARKPVAEKPVAEAPEATQPEATKDRREIPGGFPYTQAPGVLKKAVARLLISERPPHFDTDFLSTVLGASGGSARPIVPLLKRTGLLTSDGTPTERYAQFQSDSKRSQAAFEALKSGWPELFRKNRYAHKLNRSEVDDLFVEITGLTRTDPIFRAITNTYDVFREYAKDAAIGPEGTPESETPKADQKHFTPPAPAIQKGGFSIGLSNQINIVLPETTDINVYHSIFKALRESLLQ
ncbi:DUF5343 domain-containing protein [Caulobacter vibrioides]|uniref:DUF5343 domain-containing protein n=1 Tax=Caulobacter vibrioides TaxID=155892 RepID=UPI0015E78EDC|nr:DUF5343 domain-containing protein [Caulobacter vibrioides]